MMTFQNLLEKACQSELYPNQSIDLPLAYVPFLPPAYSDMGARFSTTQYNIKGWLVSPNVLVSHKHALHKLLGRASFLNGWSASRNNIRTHRHIPNTRDAAMDSIPAS
ncbi:hypothetical protein HBI56_099190 [Parastagonospora nodorum]|nr:hypothetical protein HBH52_052720 [Parastagonospora nodorum]KAH4006054.1 hypothetical protein HBI10_024880 [Parastagonospora nodorum]KAH4022956.1 hypothetical protein HBI13_092490 [Parastagonospora nodorum]KAH4054831.1 hypothetical protein HBH49_067850 [Parastagonospora nodorum]KAH4108979.1 hypothetical protein HBH46_037240 [Parastagonospora nodorum]